MIKRKIAYSLTCLVCSLVLTGCVSYQSKVNQKHSFNPNMSFLYGALFMRLGENVRGLGAGLSIIHVESGKKLNFAFENKHQMSVYEVLPGTYRLDRIIFTKNGKKSKITDPIGLEFSATPGHGIYIGDLIASADLERYSMGGEFRYTEMAWSLDSVLDNYEKTSTVFNQEFPWAKQLKKQNLAKHWRF